MIEPPSGGYANPTDPAVMKLRENLRQWRKERPLELFRYARKKFTDAGVNIYSCMFNFANDVTDDEHECAFDTAEALGTYIISANCTRKSIRRVVPFAERRRMIVSAHGENMPGDPDIDGMVFADNLVEAINLSPFIFTTPDIAHMTRYDQDVMKFFRENHERIANVHLKEGVKNHPEFHNEQNDPHFGKGTAPIKEVLQLMKTEKYPFPACIEYEYAPTRTAVEEMKEILEFCREKLA